MNSQSCCTAIVIAAIIVAIIIVIILCVRGGYTRPAKHDDFSSSRILYDAPYYYPDYISRDYMNAWDLTGSCAAYCANEGCVVVCR